MTTLVITNDFPPRIGGIEGFVAAACAALDDDVVVLTRCEKFDTTRHDASLPYEVVRLPGPLLPTSDVARTARQVMGAHGITRVLFGAAAPLGLLAGGLRRAGAGRLVALTHGHEVGWAAVPGGRQALRRIGAGVDVLGVISDHTRSRIEPALRAEDRHKVHHLPPPVDTDLFRSDPEGRARPDTQAPTAVAAGRFVRQKGFETLLAAWPRVLREVPEAQLRIAGTGPLEGRLRRLADDSDSVTFLGGLRHPALAREFAAADVFALPVRTRFAGLNPEGLGSVFLEAASAGLPVVVGRSGGAPETVIDGVTGHVVAPLDQLEIAARIIDLLGDPHAARQMGAAGRDHVLTGWSRQVIGARIRHALDVPEPHTGQPRGITEAV